MTLHFERIPIRAGAKYFLFNDFFHLLLASHSSSHNFLVQEHQPEVKRMMSKISDPIELYTQPSPKIIAHTAHISIFLLQSYTSLVRR